MLGVIGRLVRTKSPPLLLALFLVLLAGLLISNFATHVASQARPPAVVLIVLTSAGAFVMKRVLLPDFMIPTSRRKRSPRSGVDTGAKVRSRGGFSRYSKHGASHGRLNSHRHSSLVPALMRV